VRLLFENRQKSAKKHRKKPFWCSFFSNVAYNSENTVCQGRGKGGARVQIAPSIFRLDGAKLKIAPSILEIMQGGD